MKGLINRMTKWWNDILTDETEIFSLIAMFVLIAFILFCVFKAIGTEKGLSGDEICQKHFGKDYVWKNGYRGADFCVDNSGIPKYPKSWTGKE